MNALLLRLGTRQTSNLSNSSHIALKIIARAIRQEKKIKGIQIGRKNKTLFTDNMTTYVKILQRSHKITTRTN